MFVWTIAEWGKTRSTNFEGWTYTNFRFFLQPNRLSLVLWMKSLNGLSAALVRILWVWSTCLRCKIGRSCSNLSASKVEIPTKGADLLFFIHCIVFEIISIAYSLLILHWWSSRCSTTSASTDRWFHLISTSNSHWKEITTTNCWLLCLFLILKSYSCSRDSKLHCNILLSLFL